MTPTHIDPIIHKALRSVIEQWLEVAKGNEKGAISLWSPELEGLADRVYRLRSLIARTTAEDVRELLTGELRRVERLWRREAYRVLKWKLSELQRVPGSPFDSPEY